MNTYFVIALFKTNERITNLKHRYSQYFIHECLHRKILSNIYYLNMSFKYVKVLNMNFRYIAVNSEKFFQIFRIFL